ncbi:MAG: AAA family ATPase [Anaerolineales bacterium]|nr:AAA family ATPase [Anaerolineales bacterium]
MLTKLIIRNFKRLNNVEIELGNPVVFIGPNNSGKTTALQALSLWYIGLRKWVDKYHGRTVPEKRPGVTINRRDLHAIPVSSARLLWRNLGVRDVQRVNGKTKTKNVRIDITVEGVTEGRSWECGFEFDYANPESFYCRPLRNSSEISSRMPVPPHATAMGVAFLPPMSGLSDREFMKQQGEIDYLIGQGRTAEVLRNLCLQIIISDDHQHTSVWQRVSNEIEKLFGIRLNRPNYVPERSEIDMTYLDRGDIELDISSSGRGLQQTLLLLAYLAVNPNSVLLLDEPDAHLEILRQRQIYQLLSDIALAQGSQIVAASHSEVILNEAADRDVVVAFLGSQPHRIDDRGSQLLKSLKQIGFEQYYQAQQKGWVLYIEGSTDFAMLRSFAEKLDHPAKDVLDQPFVSYVLNQPTKVYDHFFGIREAKSDLVGFALFDRISYQFESKSGLQQHIWEKREFENYLCQRETLIEWSMEAFAGKKKSLFSGPWADIMRETINEVENAMRTLGKGSPWESDTKVSDDFLDPLFREFYRKLKLPNLMRKTDFHILVNYVPVDKIDPEITHVLDKIVKVAQRANPISQQ